MPLGARSDLAKVNCWQAYGAQWLSDTLVRDVPAHGPIVTNVYYLNFSGPGSTNAELINPPAKLYPV